MQRAHRDTHTAEDDGTHRHGIQQHRATLTGHQKMMALEAMFFSIEMPVIHHTRLLQVREGQHLALRFEVPVITTQAMCFSEMPVIHHTCLLQVGEGQH